MALGDLIGQDFARRVIENAIKIDRLAHSYLFAGPDGVGKEYAALGVALAVNCTVDPLGCGECNSCRKISKGVHPDVKIISPSGNNIKIDQIREIIQEISYKPFEGKKKVFIIRDAERLTQEAANCFLKTLEEPPAYIIFILLSNNRQAFLPTIISRCQVIPFYPVATELMQELLQKRFNLAEEKYQFIARLAHGSIEKAFELSEAFIQPSESKGDIFALQRDIADAWRSLRSGSISKALALAEKVEKVKEGIKPFLEGLFTFLHDILLLQQSRSKKLLVNLDQMDLIEESATKLSQREIIEALNAVDDAIRVLKYNVNTRLALEELFLKLSGKEVTNGKGSRNTF